MPKGLGGSLLARVAGFGLLGGGFWLLNAAFTGSNVPQGILGGVLIPAGMWVMVTARKRYSDDRRDDLP